MDAPYARFAMNPLRLAHERRPPPTLTINHFSRFSPLVGSGDQGLRTRNAYAKSLFVWIYATLHESSGTPLTGLPQPARPAWDVTRPEEELEAVE